MGDARPSRVAWLQLGAVVVLFGFAWPVIKIGLGASTPVWMAAARATLSAATAFVLVAAWTRLAWPSRWHACRSPAICAWATPRLP